MKKSDLELAFEARLTENEGMRCFGKLRSFGINEETEYTEICREFGRSEEGQGKAGEPSTEFKKDRFITFVASDESVDSYGDILRVDGCDLSRYKNGASAFITSHDIRDIHGACGVIVKAWKAKNVEGSANGKAVLVTVYFPTAEEDPDADAIFKKFKARTLNSVSVGFHPIETYIPANEEERKALGLGKYGIEFRKWAPYELSAVTVPANPNAQARRSISEQAQELAKLAKVGDAGSPEITLGNVGKQVSEFFAANPVKIQ